MRRGALDVASSTSAFDRGLQLKLPLVLLSVTAGFCSLFLAHTNEAYGTLLRLGLHEPWTRTIAHELRHDYLVVSLVIGVAYACFVLFACLAGSHQAFGPVEILRGHARRLTQGDYAQPIRLRSGHPLTGIAIELESLRRQLAAQRALNQALPEALVEDEPADARTKVDGFDGLVRLYAVDAGSPRTATETSLAS